MKSTGIIRKIDELGRIVIPKEIRKNLNIKDGENIEISVDSDSIILKKFYKVVNMKEQAITLIKIFEKYIEDNIILTDREKVIYSKESTYENKQLSSKLVSLIEERKKTSVLEKEKLEIVKGEIVESEYIFFPLIIDADLLGSILFISSGNIKESSTLIFNILCTLIKYELEN